MRCACGAVGRSAHPGDVAGAERGGAPDRGASAARAWPAGARAACADHVAAARAGVCDGGGGDGGNAGVSGGAGGSGIVIVRTLHTAVATTGSPTITTDGDYNIYQFTGSGSITF